LLLFQARFFTTDFSEVKVKFNNIHIVKPHVVSSVLGNHHHSSVGALALDSPSYL
jgi:hypothetical protein